MDWARPWSSLGGQPESLRGCVCWKRKKGRAMALRAASRNRGCDSSKNAKVGKVAPKMEGGFCGCRTEVGAAVRGCQWLRLRSLAEAGGHRKAAVVGSWPWVVGGQSKQAELRLALELLTVTLLCRRDRQTAEKCEMAKADCAVSLPWFMCRCEHGFVESISRNGVVARRLLQVAWSAWAPVPSCSRQDHV